MGRVGPVVACSPADREVRGLNPTQSEFLRAQEINLQGSTRPRCGTGTLRGLCLCKFDIPGCHMLAAHKTDGEIVSPGRHKR